MALPALLGAGARAVGGSMVKAGGKVAAAKILGRDKKAQPGRPTPGGESGGGRGGALVIRPKTKLVSAKEIKELQTGSPVSPGKDPLKSIYSNVIIIEKILKGTLAAEKDQLNQKKKDDKKGDREKQEQKLETKTKNPEKKKLEMPKVPGMGIFGWIKNFIGNVILGYFAVRLVQYLPQLMEIAKVMMRVVEFVADVGIKLVDGLATFIDWGYKAYDATKGFLKNIGGEKLAGAFDGLMKVVDTTITVLAFALGAQSLGGFGGGKGRGGGGRTGIGGRGAGRTPTTSSQAARRYAQRFGRDAATRRFGQEGVRSLGGKYARSGITNLARKATVGILGKGGTRAALKIVKPLVKRVPIIGGVLEFALSLLAGEPVGKAAFRAVGSGLGTWIGGALGSLIPIPFVGTAIGTFVGGAGGAELAGIMYDAFFGGKERQSETLEEPEAKQSGGPVRGFKSTTLQQQKKIKRRKPSYEMIKAPEGGQIKTGEKTKKAWWDFLGWAGTADKDETVQLDVNGQLLAKRVVDVGNRFGQEDYFGPILSLVSKFILGQKPKEIDYKNIGYGINMLIGDGVDSGKIATAGVDVSRWVTDTFRKDMADAINKNYDVGVKPKESVIHKGQPGSTSGPGSAAGERDSATGILTALGSGGGSLKDMTDQDFSDLAFIVSAEAARGTDDEYGVAAAVLNRVSDPRFPNTIMGVGTAPGQFEAVYKGLAVRDEALAKKLKDNQGKIVEALKELQGRTDFKGQSQLGNMGDTDVMFDQRGNFFHYLEQVAKTDPVPSNTPQNWKKLLGQASIEVKDRGGFIGKGLFANLGETEFVTDADSTKALRKVAPGLMMALNQAKDVKGVQSVLQQYASYEQGAQQTIIVQDAPQQQQPSPSSGGGMMVVGGGSGYDGSFEFLDYQG